MTDIAPDSVKPYSQAFERIVQGDDDIVGLIAYALYKRSIREDAMAGRTGSARRTVPDTMVSVHRNAAEVVLRRLVENAIEDATPEIEEQAVAAALGDTETRIKSHVSHRTSFGSALGVNMVAWVITLAVTFFIIWLIGRPDVPTTVANAAASIPTRK